MQFAVRPKSGAEQLPPFPAQPFVQRDSQRRAAWPARLWCTSSASRASRHTVGCALTQTLGVMTSLRNIKKRRRLTTDELLCYRPTSVSRSSVRRHYALWRERQGIPPRCDMEHCQFHTQPLLWLGQALPLILDHANGNSLDNSPKNLRYLCPNCDSQLSTRGGRNRGRVLEAGEGKYVLASRDGKRHYHLIAETGRFQITGHAPMITIGPSTPQR